MKKIAAPISFAGSQIDQTRDVCAFFYSPNEEYRVLLIIHKRRIPVWPYKAIHIVNRGAISVSMVHRALAEF